MRTDIDFSRKSHFLGASITYYPFGKPQKPEKGSGNRILGTLRATRPNFEINAGAAREEIRADVKLDVPIIGNFLHIKQKDVYYLGWASPRAALEIPLTKKGSLNLMTGYTFFFEHQEEFNNVVSVVFWRHRF